MDEEFPVKYINYSNPDKAPGGGGKTLFEVYYSLTSETPEGAFPLWTGEWITSCREVYPDFWAECIRRRNNGTIRVIDNDVYELEIKDAPPNPLFEQSGRGKGQTSAFVIDETTGSVRLPMITSFLRSSSGSTDNFSVGLDQIVNIKGGNKAVENQGWFGGPLYQSGWSDNSRCGDQDHAGPFMGFNAALCVRTGSEVRPRNVALPLYIQVYNTYVGASLADGNKVIQAFRTTGENLLNDIDTRVDNALVEIDPFGAMPDMTRAVFMEKWTADATAEWIYKINVPGYLVLNAPYGNYNAYSNEYWTASSNPIYLHYIGARTYGSHKTTDISYNRINLFGGSEGQNTHHQFFPIYPGEKTYIMRYSAKSWKDTQWFFVPCKALSWSIPQSAYFTRVAKRWPQDFRTSTYIAAINETQIAKDIFTGNWKNNFMNDRITLNNSKIWFINSSGIATADGTSGRWKGEWRLFDSTAVNKSNTNRIFINYGWNSGYAIKYLYDKWRCVPTATTVANTEAQVDANTYFKSVASGSECGNTPPYNRGEWELGPKEPAANILPSRFEWMPENVNREI